MTEYQELQAKEMEAMNKLQTSLAPSRTFTLTKTGLVTKKNEEFETLVNNVLTAGKELAEASK